MVSKLEKFRSFSPGKVIISGLYSVIYGEPAVVCSIDWGITAEIVEGETAKELRQDKYFQKIIEIFEEFSQINVDLQKINLKISSNLPRNSGLGSSAAFAASVLKVLFSFFDVKVSRDELINLVWQAENFIHGTSSGLDVTAVVVGGLISFQKVEGKFEYEQIVPDFDFKKHFTLIDSGRSAETTGEMVAKVAKKLESGEISMDAFEKQGEVSRRVILKLKNSESIAEEIQKNHEFLVGLGVVGEKARGMIGKYAAAKITGAGGLEGGSGFILVVR